MIVLLSFHDNVTGEYYGARTVFQVMLQPGTYSVHMATSSSSTGHGEKEGEGIPLEWRAKERTYIIHSLWIEMAKKT